jgi:hypothetical protein
MTPQGDPRAIFKRAIENGNLLVAEMTARELGRIRSTRRLRSPRLSPRRIRIVGRGSLFGGFAGCSRRTRA